MFHRENDAICPPSFPSTSTKKKPLDQTSPKRTTASQWLVCRPAIQDSTTEPSNDLLQQGASLLLTTMTRHVHEPQFMYKSTHLARRLCWHCLRKQDLSFCPLLLKSSKTYPGSFYFFFIFFNFFNFFFIKLKDPRICSFMVLEEKGRFACYEASLIYHSARVSQDEPSFLPS